MSGQDRATREARSAAGRAERAPEETMGDRAREEEEGWRVRTGR